MGVSSPPIWMMKNPSIWTHAWISYIYIYIQCLRLDDPPSWILPTASCFNVQGTVRGTRPWLESKDDLDVVLFRGNEQNNEFEKKGTNIRFAWGFLLFAVFWRWCLVSLFEICLDFFWVFLFQAMWMVVVKNVVKFLELEKFSMIFRILEQP